MNQKVLLTIAVAAIIGISSNFTNAMIRNESLLFKNNKAKANMIKSVKQADKKEHFYRNRINATKIGKNMNAYCPNLLFYTAATWYTVTTFFGNQLPSKGQFAFLATGALWKIGKKVMGDCLEREKKSIPNSRDMKITKALLMGKDDEINSAAMNGIIGTPTDWNAKTVKKATIPAPECVLTMIDKDFFKEASPEEKITLLEELKLLRKTYKHIDSVKGFKEIGKNLQTFINTVEQRTKLV